MCAVVYIGGLPLRDWQAVGSTIIGIGVGALVYSAPSLWLRLGKFAGDLRIEILLRADGKKCASRVRHILLGLFVSPWPRLIRKGAGPAFFS